MNIRGLKKKTILLWQTAILILFLALPFTNEVLDLPHVLLGEVLPLAMPGMSKAVVS